MTTVLGKRTFRGCLVGASKNYGMASGPYKANRPLVTNIIKCPILMRSGVLCDKRVPQKLKGKFYRTAIRLAMLYGMLAYEKIHVQQISVAEMRMLRWICGHTRRDRVRNDDIRDRLGVAPIEEKLVQHRLRWFGHVQRRPPETPVHSGILSQDSNVKRGRG